MKPMRDEEKSHCLLQNYRVLDITDEKGLLCGKLLADLGADVIKVERPGGDDSRRFGPFFKGEIHPEKSLYWFALNLNKRGITLNLKTEDGRSLFKRLVRNADFVLESFAPGYLSELGLSYQDLGRINPGIIMVSITPFGQTGPRKDWKMSDIVGMATGGFMALVGDDDRPPVRVSLDQAYFHACAEGAVAALIGLYGRHRDGKGQHIDVSIQASIVMTSISAIPFWDMSKTMLKRCGSHRVGLRGSNKRVPQQWRCKDGFVSYAIWGGIAGARTNQALVAWMEKEGMATEALRNMDWAAFDLSTTSDEQMETIEEGVARFFLTHTKEDLYQGSIKRRIQLYPIYTIEDIMKDSHLKERGFWERVTHEKLGTVITYPGAFAKSSEVEFGVGRRAPLIGEHNNEIYQNELGLSGLELQVLRQAGVI
jgi:crotonobetainyl-CoA:carnitine CoA-transferase CaiB-like acyl-CoA transferase